MIAKSACATSCQARVFFLRELNLLKVSTGLIFGTWVPPQEAKKMCPRPPTRIEKSAKRPPTAAWSELRINENTDVFTSTYSEKKDENNNMTTHHGMYVCIYTKIHNMYEYNWIYIYMHVCIYIYICIYVYIYIRSIMLLFFCSWTSIWSHRRSSLQVSLVLWLVVKSSPSSAPDLYGWCVPWNRCCRWRSRELVLYGFVVGNPWASDLMQIRSWDGLDRCHEPERCDKLSSHHLGQEWLRAFQLDPCVLSSVPLQWVEDKSPHHRCFGRVAGWASFWVVLFRFWRPWPCGCFECCHQEVSWQSPWCSYNLNGPATEPNARKLPCILSGAVQRQRSLGNFRSGRSCQSAFLSSSSPW